MPAEPLAAALWLMRELQTEDAVDVLRTIIPDAHLPLLRQLAAMVAIWHADIWWYGLQRPEGRGPAGVGWMKVSIN